MRSLPLPSLSSAASSPAGATLPAIRTEYAGSTPLVFATDGDDAAPLTPLLVSRLRADPVPVTVVPTFKLAADPATKEVGHDGGIWQKAVESWPDGVAPFLEEDFDLSAEELIAELKRDMLLGWAARGLCLLAGVAILALPFAAAFGWF